MTITAQVVKGFVGSVLSGTFDDATESPAFHEECWQLCCSKSPKVAISAPRGHAKSSAITLGYGLSTLLFRERKFLLLVSDTESQASLFLGLMRNELQNNQELIELFDIKRDKENKVQFIKDSETDIIVKFTNGDMFRVIAKGAEQKLRGLIWDGKRPDLVLCDDMENDELVMNKDRREKMRRWFYSALLPSMSASGIIRIVGTILHMDSLLERLMPENQLLTKKAKDSYLVYKDLSISAPNGRTIWKSVRYKAHTADYTSLLWPQRYTAEFFKDKYIDYLSQGIPDAYSQEYLNTPLDESTSFFKKADFLPRTDTDQKLKLNYYITVDLAIAEHERADWSVFLVAGIDENKRIHIVNVIRERIDGREIVETLMELQQIYKPEVIGIEDMQVTKSLGPFLREEMQRRNIYPNIFILKHGGKDKIARARSIQARMRTGGVKFNVQDDWFQAFQDECLQFPRAKHDDQVDTFAYLGLMLLQLNEANTPEEQASEDYEDEKRKFDDGDDGRSSITGY